MEERGHKKRVGVDIFQPIVPEYRRALFEALARTPGLDISVQASPALRSGDLSVDMEIAPYNKNARLITVFGGRLLWQRNLRFDKARGAGDVIVVCGDIHQLSSLWMAFKAKLRRIGVVWWGHHQSVNFRESRVKTRLLIARLFSDCMLCYTRQGVEMLLQHGFMPENTFATGNTVDTCEIEKLKAGWGREKIIEFRSAQELGDNRVLLFCGVLRQKARMDILLRSFKTVCEKHDDVVLIIIGAGEALATSKEYVRKNNLSENVRFLGEIRGQVNLAPWFLSSDLFVYGGAIGLSLIHSMAYGLPVVAHKDSALHGPEFEALIPGVNGETYEYEDVQSMADQICNLLENREVLCRMSLEAEKTVRDHFSMQSMVHSFEDAIRRAAFLSQEK